MQRAGNYRLSGPGGALSSRLLENSNLPLRGATKSSAEYPCNDAASYGKEHYKKNHVKQGRR